MVRGLALGEALAFADVFILTDELPLWEPLAHIDGLVLSDRLVLTKAQPLAMGQGLGDGLTVVDGPAWLTCLGSLRA